jgi:hypothetical protein
MTGACGPYNLGGSATGNLPRGPFTPVDWTEPWPKCWHLSFFRFSLFLVKEQTCKLRVKSQKKNKKWQK